MIDQPISALFEGASDVFERGERKITKR
jgi:hypothetical protein